MTSFPCPFRGQRMVAAARRNLGDSVKHSSASVAAPLYLESCTLLARCLSSVIFFPLHTASSDHVLISTRPKVFVVPRASRSSRSPRSLQGPHGDLYLTERSDQNMGVSYRAVVKSLRTSIRNGPASIRSSKPGRITFSRRSTLRQPWRRVQQVAPISISVSRLSRISASVVDD